MSAERINITWDGAVYKVSKPSWYGGMVVSASEYARLERQHDVLLAAAKHALPLIGKQPAWDWQVIEKELQAAIKDAEASQ